MDLFLALFGHLISFCYTCFDRIVIYGYIRSLILPENIAYLFKKVLGVDVITKEVLKKKTDEYKHWVECFAFDNRIPIEWAPKDKSNQKEAYVKPYLDAMKRQHKTGVYFIFKSMEQSATYRSCMPKFETDDPTYRIIKKYSSRFTHYYFYLLDPLLGPMVIRVASFLPFGMSFIINGHSFVEMQLQSQSLTYRKEDNAFLAVSDPKKLQQIADQLSPQIIKERLDHWSAIVGPRFSEQEHQSLNLDRFYSISQIEYCRNFIFKGHISIKNMFERACELSLIHITSDKIARIFGQRITQKTKGKLQTLLTRLDDGQHVFRAFFKHSALKQYEKSFRLLRNEVVSNQLSDFKLKKSLENLPYVKEQFETITNHFAAFQAQTLNSHFKFNFLAEIAQPVVHGKTKIPGIKLHDKRIIRLMEILLHSGGSLGCWKTRDIHNSILKKHRLNEGDYTINQLRYDIRKLKAHGIIERIEHTITYRMTEFGKKVCLHFILFHNKIYGPIANSLFNFQQNKNQTFNSKLEKAYNRIDRDIEKFITLLAA